MKRKEREEEKKEEKKKEKREGEERLEEIIWLKCDEEKRILEKVGIELKKSRC